MSYAKLRGRIREVFGTQVKFAYAMGMNAATISAKLNGKVEWNRDEIEKACYVLAIPSDELPEYFFNKKVAFSQL